MLAINDNFFKKKKGEILPEHLDDQLNVVSSYINDHLQTSLNALSIKVTKGAAGQAESVFCSIPNDDVGYSFINDTHFDDNYLSIHKFKKLDPSSILTSDNDGNVIDLTCSENNQLLFMREDPYGGLFGFLEELTFRKITSSDLNDNVIGGDKFKVLGNDNFADDTFLDALADNSITQGNLQDITNEKISFSCVGFEHIGIFYNLPYDLAIASQLLISDFDDLSITPDKILDNTIKWSNFIEPLPIGHHNLKNNHIADGHFVDYNQIQQPAIINENDLATFGSIINFNGMAAVHNHIQLDSNKLKLGSFKKEHFSQEVQNAINTYKQIKLDALKPPQIKKTKPNNIVYLGEFKPEHPYIYHGTQGDKAELRFYFAVAASSNGFWYAYYSAFSSGGSYHYFSNVFSPTQEGSIRIKNFPGLADKLNQYVKKNSGRPEFTVFYK